MKLTYEQVIDASLATVWAAFNDSSNKGRWQQNFASYTHTSGDPGQPGAISELVFSENGKMLVIIETITELREPVFLSANYESKYASTIIVNHFESIDENTTSWTSWCNFNFKGFMKIMALFIAGTIRKRTEDDMQRFKLLVETDEAGRT
jgi:hypothetical protein